MKLYNFTLAFFALLLASSSGVAHAQETMVVYSLGGEASPEEYAAALGSVSTALRTAGRQPQAAEANCDPDDDCFEGVLQTHQCDAAAVVTFWAQSETRDVPHLVITLADATGLVAVAEDIAPDAVLATTAAEMIGRAFYDWPRRAGVILHLDTIPSGRPVRIDGLMLLSPVTRPVMLGRHEIIVGAEGLIRRDFTVHGESEDEINLVVRLDDESGGVSGASAQVSEGSEPLGETPAAGTSEGSAWPSYAVGGGMVVAGAALWISPVLTLAGAGDYSSVTERGPPTRIEEVGMDGGQVVLAVAGSVLAVAGAVLMIGGWLRTSGTVTNEGAMLRVEGSF
ncbi:MAG: hypothetical protein ACI9KE_005821 [Polyangiales bacterium]